MTQTAGQYDDQLSARDIAQMLNAQANTLAPQLLPAGRFVGPYFCVGSIEGEPGDSLKIHVKGAKTGKWSDYSRSETERGGSGDMLNLVEFGMFPGDTAAAVRWAKGWLGVDGTIDPGKLERMKARAAKAQAQKEKEDADSAEKRRRNSLGIWQGGIELHRAPPALAYFKGRGIDFSVLGKLPRALRYRADLRHFETKRTHPAIVSAMIGANAEHLATHATFLEQTRDGRWIKLQGVESAKLIYGPPRGAHIPIWKGDQRGTLRDIKPGAPLEASEGIENGLSVALAFPDARIVAAGTLGNLGMMALPPQAGDLTLLLDNDADGSDAAGLLEKVIAAQQLAAQRDGSARRVLLRRPAAQFKDFNDQLQGKARREASAEGE